MIRGGSGGGGGSPSIAKVNLRTDDTLEFNLAISEGPIGGLIAGPRSFFLGDTPLVAPNGENNFNPVELHVFHGGDAASPVQNSLGGITSNTVVNVTFAQDIPVVRTTQPAARNFIDILEIRLLIQNLVLQTSKGDQKFNTLNMRIEFRELGTSEWLDFVEDTPIYSFTGRVTGAIKELSRRVPRIAGDWEIRITKLNPDNDDNSIAQVQWESFQSTTQEDKAYDNLAVVRGISEASDQLSGVPQFSGVYAGLLVPIPSNYDPVTRHYEGVWDGVFKLGHTDNPAWVAYSMATNPRFGAKAYFPELQVDRFSLYEAAQWCDALVPRPGGGFQPRYTYNDLIQDPRQGLQALAFVVSIFGGVFVPDAGGTLVCKVDRPGSPVQIFGLESVTEDRFNYQFTDVSTRPNELNVSYVNPNLEWETDLREVRIQEFIDRNGRNTEEFIAVGCLDTFEAQRRGYMRLLQANTETQMVSFDTARQGLLLEPFDVIGVSDPGMKWGLSGRIKAVSGTAIFLRDPLTLPVDTDITMLVQSPSGIHTLTVRSSVPYSTQLTITAGALPADLPDRAQFALEEASLGLTKLFRVLTISENDQDPNFTQITALEINTSKYSDADNMVFTDPTETTNPPPVIQKITEIQAFSGTPQLVRHGDGTIESRIRVTWKRDTPGPVEVNYRRVDQEKFQKIEVDRSEAYIPDVQDGASYIIELQIPGNPGFRTQPLVHTVVGKSTPPAIPSGWIGIAGVDIISLTGLGNTEADFSVYRIYGATAADPTLVLLDEVSATGYVRRPPSGDPYTRYKVSAVDTTGNESAPTAFIPVVPTGVTAGDLDEGVGGAITDVVDWKSSLLAMKIEGPGTRVYALNDLVVPVSVITFDANFYTFTGGMAIFDQAQLQSGNYVPGTSGWRIDLEGNAQFNDLLITGENIQIGSITAGDGIINSIDGSVINIGLMNARHLEVTDTLTIDSSTGGFSLGKLNPFDLDNDGIFMGRTEDGLGALGFGFLSGRTNSSGEPEYIQHTQNGLRIVNAIYEVAGGLNSTDEISTSQTFTLPIGTKRVSFEIGAGGGAGGDGGLRLTAGATGAPGGATRIELWDGLVDTGVFWLALGGQGGQGGASSTGVTAAVPPAAYVGGAKGSAPAPSGGGKNGPQRSGSAFDAEGNELPPWVSMPGEEGWNGQKFSVQDYDVSALTSPKMVITIGDGGLSPASSLYHGVKGRVVLSHTAGLPLLAGPLPRSPTSSGTMSNDNGSFPNLGPGLWLISTQGGDPNCGLDNVEVDDVGTIIRATFGGSAVVIGNKTPVISGRTSAVRTLNYNFYPLGT